MVGGRRAYRPVPGASSMRFIPVDKLEVEGYGKYAGLFKKGEKPVESHSSR